MVFIMTMVTGASVMKGRRRMAEKDERSELDKKWEELKTKKEAVLADYASKNPVVRQLIDLALLQNGMLKGEALNNFVKRSIELIK